MRRNLLLALTIFLLISSAACSPGKASEQKKLESLKRAAVAAGFSAEQARELETRASAAFDRFFSLLGAVSAQMDQDSRILSRVDKASFLPADYVPKDLVPLDGTGIPVSRAGFQLRKPALDALIRMQKAASGSGLVLLVSSAYRSYSYQEQVYARNVAEMGEMEASRVSAKAGASQHQLGTAVDFGSITDAFASTAASAWLEANAGSFGFSLSYPKGAEAQTGYVWESWHYRYIGPEAAALQSEFFGGYQYRLIAFLEAWRKEPQSR
ncbi:MAG TPA: M15 family metallopeptidase [Rectinemataceae bacterium]